MATKSSAPRKRTVAEVRAYLVKHNGPGANSLWSDARIREAIAYTARVYKTGSLKTISDVLYYTH